ncbi:MAG: thioesterase family protein [Anaerolineales bacterium]|nr:thioesterase family protein [Anaerolineales bacterium]
MTAEGLAPGLAGEFTQVVTDELTAGHIGSGSLRVYATPAMLMFIERSCVALLAPHLEEGRTTVGLAVQLRHLAPTPLGKTVRARVELVSVEGNLLTLRAEVWDEVEKVGEAEHRRAVIDVARFLRRVEAKNAGAA